MKTKAGGKTKKKNVRKKYKINAETEKRKRNTSPTTLATTNMRKNA